MTECKDCIQIKNLRLYSILDFNIQKLTQRTKVNKTDEERGCSNHYLLRLPFFNFYRHVHLKMIGAIEYVIPNLYGVPNNSTNTQLLKYIDLDK